MTWKGAGPAFIKPSCGKPVPVELFQGNIVIWEAAGLTSSQCSRHSRDLVHDLPKALRAIMRYWSLRVQYLVNKAGPGGTVIAGERLWLCRNCFIYVGDVAQLEPAITMQHALTVLVLYLPSA